MKILMDADCLIKLTKSGLKEKVCQQYEIAIPAIVKKEVVEAGKRKVHPDAEVVEKNIKKDIIRVVGKESSTRIKGDQALIEIYKRGRYDAIGTDDAKLMRVLRLAGIPYILPGLFIYSLYRRNIIDKATAMDWLNRLSNFISKDEHSLLKFLSAGK